MVELGQSQADVALVHAVAATFDTQIKLIHTSPAQLRLANTTRLGKGAHLNHVAVKLMVYS